MLCIPRFSQDGAVRAWNRSMMLFPPCPLTARDRHQGKLIPPVKRGVSARAIVTVGPLSPKLSGRIGATGSPSGQTPAGELPAGPAGGRTPTTL